MKETFFEEITFKGIRVTQLIECPTPGFGLGHDLKVISLSPAWSSMLIVESAGDSLPLFLTPTPTLSLSK